jgi:hypothetical protein
MRSMRDVVQGRDRSVRGIVSKEQFVQGAQQPRTFGQGHIGRGHIDPREHKEFKRETQRSSAVLPFSMIDWNVIFYTQRTVGTHSIPTL